MKKIILLPLLFAAVLLRAQAPFEGTVTLKVMNSYSQEQLNMMPYVFSGAENVIVSIKGDDIHEYFQQRGLHKIYADGKLYYYSENLKEGFYMDEHNQDISKILEDQETNEKRTFLGQTCAVMKRTSALNMVTIKLDYWLAENSWNISEKALERLHSDLTSRALTDLGGKVCLKMSAQVYMTGSIDQMMAAAKGTLTAKQREQMFGSADKDAKEMSSSQIAEVISIEAGKVPDDAFQPAADIRLAVVAIAPGEAKSVDQKTNDLVREAMKQGLMSNPAFAKKVAKGKIDLEAYVDEKMAQQQQLMATSNDPRIAAAREMMEKSAADQQAIGASNEDFTFNQLYTERETELLKKNKEWLKGHEKIAQEAVKPVAYDLDEEWDF